MKVITPVDKSLDWETEAMARGHGDLVGPIDPSVVGGEHYLFVTFDEGSKYIKVVGIVSKTPEETSRMYVRLWEQAGAGSNGHASRDSVTPSRARV